MADAYHLRKRAIIETIFDQLKNICQIEHSIHRSAVNYFNNIFAALIAYNFKEKKTSLKHNFVDTKQLIMFKSYIELTLSYFFFRIKSFLMDGEDVNHNKNPLSTVINPKSEKALKTIVLKLSLPS